MTPQEQLILNYPLFDGRRVIENASVIIENGRISDVAEAKNTDSRCLLIPGLIDAHTHITAENQINDMLQNGVTAACDVSAPASLIEKSTQFTIVSSAGMTMGTLSGALYVNKAIKNRAKYIKVLLMEPNLMLKSVLKDICSTAHKNRLKVAAHATSLKTVRLAVECGVDILLHVPLKEEFPEDLARTISLKGIALAPTLVMMEAFADSGRNGYRPSDYRNAENAVRMLYGCGVKILAATDANVGSYTPAVSYGTSLHREMELLVRAGMTPADVLKAATGNIAETFCIEHFGTIEKGKRAVLLLIEGRPDKQITDTVKIKHIWIDGDPICGGGCALHCCRPQKITFPLQ